MKKILFVLLIAIITCVDISEEITPANPFNEEDLAKLQAWLEGHQVEIEEVMIKIKKFVKKAIDWLKKKGIWDTLVQTALNGGKKLAVEACKKYFPTIICEPVIGELFKLLGLKEDKKKKE